MWILSCKKLAHCWLLVSAFVLASPVEAQTRWQSVSAEGGPVASATNASGYEFRVEPAAAGGARCHLLLPAAGSETLAVDRLPKLVVDDGEPQVLLPPPDAAPVEEGWENPKARRARQRPDDGGDLLELARHSWGGLPVLTLEARRVTFLCWQPLAGQTSPTRGLLRQLLDGEELRLVSSSEDGGERQVSFSLVGAGESIVEALAITAQPTRQDLLQEELLGFRVRYRGQTCYRLQGRKRQNRCLEAVNRCAQAPHDSLLSMLECVEGK